jgi:hypothetical protein
MDDGENLNPIRELLRMSALKEGADVAVGE